MTPVDAIVSGHLVERALKHAVDAAERDDHVELRRIMKDTIVPTLRMLDHDRQVRGQMIAQGREEAFEKAFNESGDADICRAILGGEA